MKYFAFIAIIGVLASCSPVKKGLINDKNALVGGKNIENLTVGVSVYESQEAFQSIAGKVQSLPEAGAYFSTFEPVALQYAVSANNQ